MYFTGGMFSLILRQMPITQTKLLFHEIFCDLVVNERLWLLRAGSCLHFLFPLPRHWRPLCLIEHELVLILLQELAAPLLVKEQRVDLLDVLDTDLRPLPLLAGQTRHGDELDGVTQTGLTTDLGEDSEGVIRDLRVLLPHLILRISSYWVVGMMIVLSSRSRGRPWGLV